MVLEGGSHLDGVLTVLYAVQRVGMRRESWWVHLGCLELSSDVIARMTCCEDGEDRDGGVVHGGHVHGFR